MRKLLLAFLILTFSFGSFGQMAGRTTTRPGQGVISTHHPRTNRGTLITSNLAVEYKLDEGSGLMAANTFGVTPSPNLLGPPEQSFTAPFWSLNNVTPTEYFLANPIDSNVTATKMLSSGAPARVSVSPPTAIPAGTYTYTVYLISNTGGSQTVSFSYFNGILNNSTDRTVTTSWQRFTFNVVSVTPITSVSVLQIDSGNNAYNVSLYGPQFEPGAVASAYVPSSLNLMLGGQGTVSTQDPTWPITGGLQFNSASSQFAYGTTSPAVTLTNCSSYLAFRQTGDGNISTYAPGIGTAFGLGGQFNLNPRTGGYTTFQLSGTAAIAYAAMVNDNQWHILAGTYDGTNLRTYLDGVEMAVNPAVLVPVNIQTLFMGLTGSAYLKGNIQYALIYTVGHTPNQVIQNTQALQDILTARGVTIGDLNQFLVYEGDSITNPAAFYGGPSYWQIATDSYTPSLQGRNFAQSGNTVANAVIRFPQTSAMYNPARSANIVSIFFGANDLHTVSPAVFVANLKSLCLMFKALGFRVVVGTVLPQTLAGFDALRTTANALIRADPSFWDALADWGADPTIGCNGCASNLTYYEVDGLHPTGNGHAIMAPYEETAVGSVR